MQNNRIMGACLLAPLALAFAAPASSNPLAQGAPQMAYMAGSMHAAAEACGDYTPEKLDGMLREQKAALTQMGVSEADFDAEFKRGFQDGKAKIESATPQEREQNCAKLRSMSAAGR